MTLSLAELHRLKQRFAAVTADLIDWETFTLTGFRHAIEGRLDGTIVLIPFHWRNASHFGFTCALNPAGCPCWLVFYESERDADHQLAIILPELMHVLLGHAQAPVRVTPEMLRDMFQAAGLIDAGIDPSTALFAYARRCMTEADAAMTIEDQEARDELEAEMGAMWVLAQAREAGALPPSGLSFAAEHRALDENLRGEDDT